MNYYLIEHIDEGNLEWFDRGKHIADSKCKWLVETVVRCYRENIGKRKRDSATGTEIYVFNIPHWSYGELNIEVSLDELRFAGIM